jgi:hypothetical protein
VKPSRSRTLDAARHATTRLFDTYRQLTAVDSDGRTLLQRVEHAGCDLTATPTDTDRVTGTGVSDPTAATVIHLRDEPNRDLHRLYTEFDTIRQAVERIEQITDRYPPAGQVAAVVVDLGPSCRSCQRLNHRAPVHRTTTLAGLLDEPTPLCRWCYDFTARHRLLPPRAVLRHHIDHPDDRIRVRTPDDGRTGTVIASGQVLATIPLTKEPR